MTEQDGCRTIWESTMFQNEYGTIRVAEWPEGIVLWVGGEIRWKSWQDPKLWNVRSSL